MAWEYTLSKLFPQGQAFRVNHKDGDLIKSTLIRFEYGKTYRTEDEVLIKSIKSLHGRYPKNTSNRKWLETMGVAFEEVPCSSCGGRVMKYQAGYFEVKEV